MSDVTLQLHFEGWFQCRLATNSDPTDEPRGVSGTTFALVGEPDLDRVIRFQDPVALRSGMSRPFGVFLTDVSLQGSLSVSLQQEFNDLQQLLLQAPVTLLDDAKFEGYNGVIARSGEPIDPFHLMIRSTDDSVCLQRRALWDVGSPELSVFDASPEALAQRKPGNITTVSPRIRRHLDISQQPDVYWNDRRNFLMLRLQSLLSQKPKGSLLTQEVLQIRKRISLLEPDFSWHHISRNRFLKAWTSYNFFLQDTPHICLPHTALMDLI